MNGMNVVWLSANLFGHEVLKEALKVEGTAITAILTLSESSRTVMYDSVEKGKWGEFGIPVYEIDSINESKGLLGRLKPDLVIMCGWRQVVQPDILNVPKHGFVGFHPTLLPKGRGPAPIINSILQGCTKSGVTFFHITGGLDDGDIIGQKSFDISPNDHASEVYGKVISAGKELIRKYLPLIPKGNAPRMSQDHSKATYFEKPSLEHNALDLDDSLENIHNKIRALSKPYRGACILKDGKKLTIWRSSLE